MNITPARFEDEMQKIISSAEDEPQKILRVVDLMLETLDSLGYGAGIKKFRSEGKDNDRTGNLSE